MSSLNSTVADIFQELQTGVTGLSEQEAKNRLKSYGLNSLEQTRMDSNLQAFARQFSNPLVIILLISAALSVFLGETSGAVIIVVIVVSSVCLQFYHERRSIKAAAALSKQVAVHASVLRDGAQRDVEISNVVPGDIVFLSAGDIIPGDARILSENSLYVNQASLTGESFPIEKRSSIETESGVLLSEMDYAVFMGSSVTSGMGQAVVVATGRATEIGKIAHLLTAKPPVTDFEHGIHEFSVFLVKLIVILVAVIFLINALMHKGFFESFLFAVAISVGITPELLPMIMTVNMANGAVKMAHKGVIVKWLEAIQNFGSMDILCSDKTGTLTEGEFKLTSYEDVAGKADEKIFVYAYLNSLLQGGMKNPLDLAIIAAGHPEMAAEYVKAGEVPFDFVRRMLSVVVSKKDELLLIVKGAPESVIKRCTLVFQDGQVQLISDETKEQINKQFADASSQGHRVIAVAYKPVLPRALDYSLQDEENLIFAGTISFFDPPKESVAAAIRDLEDLGVSIKILTGDNEFVARKVCEDVGIPVERIITGSELDLINNDALVRIVDTVSVFARMTPAQKDRIINLYRKKGHVVGFIGDGINDAPSLRVADVGISVNNAVDVAKEAASLILLDKSLAALKDGVIEGRRTYANTMKYIMMETSSNFGNMFSMLVATVLVPFLPMLPIQILLNNFLYDVSQLAIPVDAVDAEAVSRPRRWDLKFIRRFMLVFGLVSSIFDVSVFVLMIYVFRANEATFQTGWFIESLATQVLVVYIIRSRYSIFKSSPSKWLVLTTLVSLSIGILIPYSVLGQFFGFVPMSAPYFLSIVGLVVAYLVLVEYVKQWFLGFMGGWIGYTKLDRNAKV